MNLQIVSTTISVANQTAVPSPIREALDLKPGDKLLWEMGDKKIVKIKPAPRSWGKYMRGLGKNIWSDTNAKTYLSHMRKDRVLP